MAIPNFYQRSSVSIDVDLLLCICASFGYATIVIAGVLGLMILAWALLCFWIDLFSEE